MVVCPDCGDVNLSCCGLHCTVNIIHLVELQRPAEEPAHVFKDSPMNEEKPHVGLERAYLSLKALKP